MRLTFAGEPLILEDPAGTIARWIEQYVPISDLRLVTRWPRSPWSSWLAAYPNYADPVTPKLNTWYRPVGASRWAYGLFLVDSATAQRILQAVGSTNTGHSLRFETPNFDRRGWLAYLLPPHPVSADIGDSRGLWVLPIVDERWYWQFIDAGRTRLDDLSSWGSLFATLASQLGITLNVDSVPSAYGTPHADGYNAGNAASAAAVLDAAAWSVGQRVVLQYQAAGPDSYWAEVYQSCNWATSQQRLTHNFSQPLNGALQAGVTQSLNVGALYPETLRVAFRKWANGIVWPDEYHLADRSASNYTTLGYTAGVVRTIHSAALADFTGGSGTPDNAAAIDALADQIATDFFASLKWVQDSVYFDVAPWIETGWDDYAEWQIGRRRPDGSYTLQLRVHSQPYNLGINQLLHHLPNTHEYPETIEGKLDGALSAFGTATLSVWDEQPVGDSSRNVVVTDRLGWDAPAGAWCVATAIGREWRPIAISCDPVI